MSIQNRFRELISKVSKTAPVKNQQTVLDAVAKGACQSFGSLVPGIFDRLLDSLYEAGEQLAKSGKNVQSRQALAIYSLVYEHKLDFGTKLNQRFEVNIAQALDNFLQKREEMKTTVAKCLGEWTLMETEEVDKMVVMKNLANKLQIDHDEFLFELCTRLATVTGVTEVPPAINPLRPALVVDSIHEVWQSLKPSHDPAEDLLFTEKVTVKVIGDLRPMYLDVIKILTDLNIQSTRPTPIAGQSSGRQGSSTLSPTSGFVPDQTLTQESGSVTEAVPLSFINRLKKMAGKFNSEDIDSHAQTSDSSQTSPDKTKSTIGSANTDQTENSLTTQLLSQLVSKLPVQASAPTTLRPMASEAMSVLVPQNAKSDVLNALGYLQSAQLQRHEQFREALSPDLSQSLNAEGQSGDYLDPLSPVDLALAGSVKFVNVVRSIQQSEIGQKANLLNATVIELVARVFDFVFEDKYISDTVKLLLSRLQIPLLKAALLDVSFFEQSDHPARKLVNVLSSAAMGWQEADGQQSPLFVLIENTVNRVVSEFKEDLSLFDALSDEVNAFVKRKEEETQRQTELERQQAQEQATENENQELARRVARQAIEERLIDKTTAPFVSNFLRDVWVKYVCRLLIISKNDTTLLSSAMITADDLLWSVEPKSDTLERARMLAKTPVIENQLRSGIASIEWSGGYTKAFFTALDDRWAGAVIGEPILTNTTEVATNLSPPLIQDLEDEEDRAIQLVTELVPGTLIQLIKDDGAQFVYKIGWVSEAKTRFLLTNRLNSAPLIVTAKYLAEQYRVGKMQLMDRQPLMDRALNSMLDALEETRYSEQMMHETGVY